MTPKLILEQLIEEFSIPNILLVFLAKTLQLEIEQNYPSLRYTPEYDKEDPTLRYAKGLIHIFSKLPKIYNSDESKLIATIETIGGLDDSDQAFLHSLCTPIDQLHYQKWRSYYSQKISECQDAIDRREKGQDVTWERAQLRYYKEQQKENTPPETFIYYTKFWWDLVSFNVSFDIPKRNRHCHIIGQPGTGKTELILKLCRQDIESGASVIAMSPKGALIETLAQIPGENIIWLKDWSQVGLNLADLDTHLLIYVFEGLLESEPTPKQKAYLGQYVPKVKSLNELRSIKVDKEYAETAAQINWRLDLMPKVIDEILSRPTNVNVREIMDSGGVLLLDTKHLGEGASFIGRLFIALIARITHDRTSRHPCYVYIDEAQKFVSESGFMEDLLDMAREANVGLTLAHQTLAQFNPRLIASVHNTATKFVGKCNSADAGAMAREIRVNSDDIQDLPDYTFFLSTFKKPFRITPGKFVFTATQREHFTIPRHVEHTASNDNVVQLKAAEPEAKHTPDPKNGPWKW